MRIKKEELIIIGFAFILLFVVFTLVYFAIQPKPQKNETSPVPTLTPSPTTPAQNGRPALLYDEKQQDKLMNYVKNRQPLSNSDRLAKANVLATIPTGQRSGILSETKNIRIDYTSSADVFQVEIVTTDIQAAKAEANLWFRARGFSQTAICTMPVVFYMNFEVANSIRQTNTIFDPLGNGC